MATHTTFNGIPKRHQKILHELLSAGEEFITATTYGQSFFTKSAPFHILTNKRLITIQKTFMSEEISDIQLSQISRVQFRSNPGGLGAVEVEGAGFDESFKAKNPDGRQFSNAVRDQLGKRKEVA